MRDRKLNRKQGYNYQRDGCYFITSCVQNMHCCLGEVINSQMHLNAFGKIAEQQWAWLTGQYPYIRSHAFIVMPNHIHGILEINASPAEHPWTGKIKSISQLMGAYKTTTSKKIHMAGFLQFAWKRSFHDHIIRTPDAFERIRNYILHNPANWQKDSFHKT